MEVPYSALTDSDQAWYFGYGSNMNAAVFEGRRKIKPLEKKVGVLKGYKYMCNLRGIPWLEPSFANVKKLDGEEVHGVLAKITKQDFDNLIASESGDDPDGYVPTWVQVVPYGESTPVVAYTLVVRPDSPRLVSWHHAPPSERYMKLVVEGAKANNLEPKYIEELQKMATYKSSLRKFIVFATVLPLAPLLIFFFPPA